MVRNGDIPERQGSTKGGELVEKLINCSLRCNSYRKKGSFCVPCAFYKIFAAGEKLKFKAAVFNL